MNIFQTEFTLLVLYLLWIISSAIIEAVLYSKQGAEAFKVNEHYLYTLNRISVLSMIIVSVLKHEVLLSINGIMLAISFIMMYPFWHDGAYYETRRAIDVPSYNFKSSSTTSTAKFELNWNKRLTLFIIGFLLPYLYKITTITLIVK